MGYRTGSTNEDSFILVTVCSGYYLNERAENVLCHIFIILLAIQRAGLAGQKKTFGKEEVEDEDEEKERTESGASPRPRKVRPSISASEEKDPLRPIPSQAVKLVDFG